LCLETPLLFLVCVCVFQGKFRGTSVYLVQKRIDMLPKLLTTDLCSLRGNVDRLSFSCVWILDTQTAEILDVKFHKSVIRSVSGVLCACVHGWGRWGSERVRE